MIFSGGRGIPVQFGPVFGRSCHGRKSSSSSVRVRGPGGFENSSPNSNSQLFFAVGGGVQFEFVFGRTCHAARGGSSSSSVRIPGGVENSSSISSSNCLNPSSARSYFFRAGEGVRVQFERGSLWKRKLQDHPF